MSPKLNLTSSISTDKPSSLFDKLSSITFVKPSRLTKIDEVCQSNIKIMTINTAVTDANKLDR